MLYFLAVMCPPLACLCAGRFGQSVVSACLCSTVIYWPVACVHAWFIAQQCYEDRQQVQVVDNRRPQLRLKRVGS